MRDGAHRNPADPDAGALFAESMMDLHPWRLWNADGTAVPGTDEIVATLEGVIAKYPGHVGANHYYIHAVEASNDPGRALASAERRGDGGARPLPSAWVSPPTIFCCANQP